eukprot:7334815-Alexandrium_andersonii.AAC.1
MPVQGPAHCARLTLRAVSSRSFGRFTPLAGSSTGGLDMAWIASRRASMASAMLWLSGGLGAGKPSVVGVGALASPALACAPLW